MNKIYLSFLVINLLASNIVSAHCQIPCGIYDDASRIILIKENFQTIKKSMDQIERLSDLSDPLSKNQTTRWIFTKEYHAQDIQDIISEYFLTQRIKESDKEYTKKLEHLHKLLFIAMKCKQTINTSYIDESNSLIDYFSILYFDKHGLEHLEKLSK